MSELTPDEIEEIMWGDSYKEIYTKITDQDRWSTHYEAVYQRDDKYFMLSWSRGSTEYQDQDMENVMMKEVVPTEKTITVYV